MSKNLQDYRKSYEKGALTQDSVAQNPFKQFELWFNEAEASTVVEEVNAMTLATTGEDGFPRGRVVLLKEFNEEGFTFYTNYKSEKGEAISANCNVCISFFWPGLERQVIIKGIAEKVSEEKSVNYFKQRPRKSQLGALVSEQSQTIADRETLEKKMVALEEKYRDKDIPKPKDWGGYLIKPIEFEFWQGRRSRLHDRIVYHKKNDNWKTVRVQP